MNLKKRNARAKQKRKCTKHYTSTNLTVNLPLNAEEVVLNSRLIWEAFDSESGSDMKPAVRAILKRLERENSLISIDGVPCIDLVPSIGGEGVWPLSAFIQSLSKAPGATEAAIEGARLFRATQH